MGKKRPLPAGSIPVSAELMRQMFNDGGYFEMIEAGQLDEVLVDSRHPSAPLAPVPYCTESQGVAYRRKDGTEVAFVHQYLMPNGKLGASGLPDPKRLLHKGKHYHFISGKTR